MRIPEAERERLVDQVVEDLAEVLPLARERIRVRVRKAVHDAETLHEFWRGKARRAASRRWKSVDNVCDGRDRSPGLHGAGSPDRSGGLPATN